MAAFDTLIDFPDDGEEVGMFKLNILGGATDFNQRYSIIIRTTCSREKGVPPREKKIRDFL